MASKSKIIAELFEADGDIVASALDNVVVTPTAISDQANTSTGGLSLPAGTTAQRPGSPDTGESRFNSTTGSLEFYDGSAWINTNLIPSIDSVTGTIYAGAVTNLVLALTNATDTVDILYKEGGVTVASTIGVTVTSGSVTTAVPSAVYGQTAGDTISVSINNADGTPSSNAITKTVIGLPSGGTLTTSGSYRYHTFNSSSNFVVPSGFAATAEYLLVAGGGSTRAGDHATGSGGGGAGGAIDSTVSLSAQTYSIVIGAGGAGASGAGNGNSGSNSTAFSSTANGGGRGAGYSNFGSASGGSGGGGSYAGTDFAGSAGTAGQGNAGGDGSGGDQRAGGGGGGKGAVGGNASGTGTSTAAGNGGVGINWKSLGTFYAGGGGGGVAPWTVGGKTAGAGGNGGGGAGGRSSTQIFTKGTDGTVNTGGGAGGSSINGPSGGGGDDLAGANGGSGVVIVRYQLP